MFVCHVDVHKQESSVCVADGFAGGFWRQSCFDDEFTLERCSHVVWEEGVNLEDYRSGAKY
jgi:hypothetical protein